jgi:hypothetical protein
MSENEIETTETETNPISQAARERLDAMPLAKREIYEAIIRAMAR